VRDFAFVVMHVGPEGSEVRSRADEVTEYVIEPILGSAEFDLDTVRSDQDATPGSISPKMLRDLIGARVVIADLTGRNPNVYYELGVAHSFRRAVISLGQPSGLPFDVQDERVIPLPDLGEKLGVKEAAVAKRRLIESLRIVLVPGYEPASPLSSIATRQALSELAPQDPLASEISTIRDAVDDLRNGLVPLLPILQQELLQLAVTQPRPTRVSGGALARRHEIAANEDSTTEQTAKLRRPYVPNGEFSTTVAARQEADVSDGQRREAMRSSRDPRRTSDDD
jgi:hypothetical protein